MIEGRTGKLELVEGSVIGLIVAFNVKFPQRPRSDEARVDPFFLKPAFFLWWLFHFTSTLNS